MSRKKQVSSFSKDILKQALIDSFKKFDPRIMIKNPVIFIVEIGFFLTLALTICPTLFSKMCIRDRINLNQYPQFFHRLKL